MPSDWNDLPDLPPELEGALSDLGAFRAEYRAGWTALLYLLLGVLMLAGGVLGTAFFVGIIKDERLDLRLFHVMFACVGMVVGGAFMCFRSARAWGTRVLVFDRCLVFLKRRRLRVLGFHEIAGFQQRTPTGSWEKLIHGSYYLILYRRDGERFRIDTNVTRAKELGARVQAEFNRRKEAAEPTV